MKKMFHKRVVPRIIDMTSKITPKFLSEYSSKIFSKNIAVTGLSIDSNKIEKGFLFIALAGSKTHGLNHLETAIRNGAVAVLSDRKVDSSIPSFDCPNPRELVGKIAAWLFDYPFKKLNSVGITGTNGKTTSTSFIKQIWDINKIDSALIGTLGVSIGSTFVKGDRTTPEADELQKIASQIQLKGIKNLVMEVSSHAIDQFRIKGCQYKLVCFTNLSQDHLDYHKTMENYFNTKAQLFTKDYADLAIINLDDEYGSRLLKQVNIPVQSISRSNIAADWCFEDIVQNSDGYSIKITSKFGNKISGQFRVLGDFNLDNLLIAVVASSLTGLTDNQISNSIEKITSVSGRLEIINSGQKFKVIVDYAHTPDAVTRVLNTVRAFTDGRVIAILGCGGDRDKGKRPMMGKALLEGSDIAVFTSDNPRSEQPTQILRDMTAGLELTNKGFIIEDRKQAIEFACKHALPSDCVVLLGKGHEVGQEINGVILPFDDRIEISNVIKQVK